MKRRNAPATSGNVLASQTWLLVMFVISEMYDGIGFFGRTNDTKLASSIGMPFRSKMTAANSIISFLMRLTPVVSKSKITYITFSQLMEEGSWMAVTVNGGVGGTAATGF